MTITEYYQCYKTTAGKKLIEYPIVIEANAANKFSELYEKCINQHIASISANIIKWHNMFMRYVELPDAIFWIRRYESSSETEKVLHNGRWVNRRACKTEHADGFSYVFVSNFDAHEIFNMVRLGVEPNEYEFLKLMKNHEFPLHYDSGKSCEESDIALYPKIGDPRFGILTVNHWYLAHILSVNDQNDYICPADFSEICPRGSLSDWNNDGGYMVRRLNNNLSLHEKELIKAHFLRLVDPINYYIVPGKCYQDNHNYHFKNNQIGEYPSLNNYVSRRFADIYGESTMDQFRKIVLAKPLPDTVDDESIDISYGPNPVTGTHAYTVDEQVQVAAYFLTHSTGLAKAEQNILNCNSHGNVARKILISLGIDTSITSRHKGLLIHSDIDNEIAKATGNFKYTLEEIKNRGLNKIETEYEAEVTI